MSAESNPAREGAVIAPRVFTLPQLAEAAGIEYRTAHIWRQRGLLVPSLYESEGTGHPNLFSFPDVVAARVLGELRNAGLSIDVLAVVSTVVRDEPDANVLRVALGQGHILEVNVGGARYAADVALAPPTRAEVQVA